MRARLGAMVIGTSKVRTGILHIACQTHHKTLLVSASLCASGAERMLSSRPEAHSHANIQLTTLSLPHCLSAAWKPYWTPNAQAGAPVTADNLGASNPDTPAMRVRKVILLCQLKFAGRNPSKADDLGAGDSVAPAMQLRRFEKLLYFLLFTIAGGGPGDGGRPGGGRRSDGADEGRAGADAHAEPRGDARLRARRCAVVPSLACSRLCTEACRSGATSGDYWDIFGDFMPAPGPRIVQRQSLTIFHPFCRTVRKHRTWEQLSCGGPAGPQAGRPRCAFPLPDWHCASHDTLPTTCHVCYNSSASSSRADWQS